MVRARIRIIKKTFIMAPVFRELVLNAPFRRKPWKSITFPGGGFQTVGHCGAVAILSPNVDKSTQYYGDSMGAMFAATAALFLHYQPGLMFDMISDALLYVQDVQDSWCNTLSTCQARFREIMIKHFPEDISAAQDRCFVSVSYLSYPFSQRVSRFTDKTDLINTVLASMYIPLWSQRSFFYTFRGRYAIDGSLFDHCPQPPNPSEDHYTVARILHSGKLLWPSKKPITETVIACGEQHRIETIRQTKLNK
jgi:hypothetical protein